MASKKRKLPAHSVCLCVDSVERKPGERESFTKIYDKLCKRLGAENVERRPMDSSDYTFSVDGSIVIMVERKSANDFKGSMNSSHFREQKWALLKAEPVSASKEYLIEGLLSQFDANTQNRMMGAMVNMQRRDGILVYRTLSLDETIDWLCKTFEKLGEYGYNPGKRAKTTPGEQGSTDHAVAGASEYVDTFYKRKTKIVTPRECFIQQLTCIPKVSLNLAKSIAEKHENMPGLVRWLRKRGWDPKALSGFEYEIVKTHRGSENNTRKIGKNSPIAKNIVEFLRGN